MPHPLPSTVKEPTVPKKPVGVTADDFTFRAPRWSDLTACPLCARTPDDPWLYRCDLCGDECHVFTETTQ